jgi:hypothetical protein
MTCYFFCSCLQLIPLFSGTHKEISGRQCINRSDALIQLPFSTQLPPKDLFSICLSWVFIDRRCPNPSEGLESKLCSTEVA